jgi:hypothetical protein
MSTTDRKKRRSPSELLAIAQQRVAALELAALQDSKTNHPAMQELIDLDLALAKQTAVLMRNFTKGPQSLEYRLAKHRAWCDEISASYDYSMALVLDNGNKRHAISDSIANGMRLAVESGEVAEIGIELQCVRDVLADPKPHIAELSIKLTKCIQARIALSERAIANEASA